MITFTGKHNVLEVNLWKSKSGKINTLRHRISTVFNQILQVCKYLLCIMCKIATFGKGILFSKAAMRYNTCTLIPKFAAFNF